MNIIENGDKVQVTFEGKLENGQVFYENKEEKPMIVVGENQIFPAIEKELIGMKTGETKTVTLEPKDAFGEHNEHLLLSISKDKLNPDADVAVGNILETVVENGKKLKGIIVDISENIVTVDFNHPFAGKKIIVSWTVIAIEKQNT